MNKMKIAATALIAFAVLTMGFAAVPDAMAAQGSFAPYAAQSGQNLTIFANGTVSNSSLVTVNGNVYTLTGNLAGNLLVNASNIVVSGHGHSVNGYFGIQVENVTDVTITDFGANSGSNYTYLTTASTGNITISDSIIANQTGGETYVGLSYSANVVFVNDTINNAYVEAQWLDSLMVTGSVLDSGYLSAYQTGQVDIASNTFESQAPSINAMNVQSFAVQNNTALYITSVTYNDAFFYVSYSGTVNISNDNLTAISPTNSYGLYFEYDNSVNIYNVSLNNYSEDYLSNVGNVSIVNSSFQNITGYNGFSVDYIENLVVKGSSVYTEANQRYANGLNLYQIQSVTITNSMFYGYYAADLETITNLVLLNSTIATNLIGYSGIYLYEVTKGVIADNTVYVTNPNSNTYGIFVDEFSNVSIVDNTIYSMTDSTYQDGYGIYAEYLLASSFTGNTITSYNGTSNFNGGIYLYDVMNAVVSGNTVNGTAYAISDEEGIGNSIVHNLITGNQTVDAFYVGYSLNFNISSNSASYSLFGLYVEYNTGGVFWNNTFSNTAYYGIEGYDNTGVLFSGNTFTASQSGFSGIADSYSVSVEYVGNTFTNFYTGVESEYSSGSSFINNQFQSGQFALNLQNVSDLTFSGNTFAYYTYLMDFNGNLSSLSFYHNNFVSYTYPVWVNITPGSLLLYNVVFDMGSVIGGNFWTNYTGPYSNGLGTTSYSIGFGLSDNHPLQNPWADPVITFVATGLAPHTLWSVTVNSVTYTTDAMSVTVPFVNGAYGPVYYTVGAVAGYSHKASSGTVYFSGSSVTAFVNYQQVKYGVTFSTTGLPSGTTVSLTVNNATYTVSGSDTLYLPNGTYSYSVALPAGFTTSKAAGTFTVSGGATAVSIPFRTTGYTVTFTETGLSGSFSWNVTVNGKTYNGTGTSISVGALQPGSYAYTIHGPSGYTFTGTGNISVSQNETVLVVFSSSHTGAGAGLLAAAIVGSIAAGFVAMLLVALFAPQVVDSLRNKLKGSGGSRAAGNNSGSSQETAQQEPEEGSEAKADGKGE